MPTKSNDGSDSATESHAFTRYGSFNYLKQINAFWLKVENDCNDEVGTTAIAVYFALLQINNRTGWKPKFKVHYSEALAMSGIGTPKTYYLALDVLVRAGYIHYWPGKNQTVAAVIQIIALYDQEAPENSKGGKRKEAPAQPEQSNKPILPPASEFEGLHPDMLHNWEILNRWIDSDPYLACLRMFRRPLTPREFDKLLSEYEYGTIQIKCEEIANKVVPTEKGAPLSLFMLLKQYLRMHKELD